MITINIICGAILSVGLILTTVALVFDKLKVVDIGIMIIAISGLGYIITIIVHVITIL